MNKSRFSVRIAIYTIMVVLGMTSTLTRVPTAWSGGGGAPADGGGLPASGPSDIEGKQRVETNQRKAEPSGPQAVEQQDNEQRATGNPDKSVEGEVGNNTANDKDSDEEEIGELGVLDTERFKASARVVPFSGGNDKVVIHIVISDVIDLGLAPFISRVIADVKERSEVVAIVSEIDTPGGRVDAAVQIKDALLNASVPTVAWVHSEAISAGALIAYAMILFCFLKAERWGRLLQFRWVQKAGPRQLGKK